MRYALGYDAPEIARRLGYRPSSIGKVTTRGLAALRGELTAAAR
jgi:DNA-directed RNA polymerase specialized sigma24 family protein